MGGHSGLNIAEDRGNAVRFVARLADAVLKAAPKSQLARISGGDKRNAIAREASADLVVCKDPMMPNSHPGNANKHQLSSPIQCTTGPDKAGLLLSNAAASSFWCTGR